MTINGTDTSKQEKISFHLPRSEGACQGLRGLELGRERQLEISDFFGNLVSADTLGVSFFATEGVRMDAKRRQLEEKLEFQLSQAAHTAAEIQAFVQGDRVPHFDEIEMPAHDLGKKLSRAIQGERAREVAIKQLGNVRCPECNQQCRVEIEMRDVHSMDGPIKLTEPVAHCRRCRRSFFPSAERPRV